MRIVILAAILVYVSVVSTGATLVVPNIEFIEFIEPIVISTPDKQSLCKKYDILFLDVLHKSLECTEQYGPAPYMNNRCEKLRSLLGEYSRLRSYYCYGEHEEEI